TVAAMMSTSPSLTQSTSDTEASARADDSMGVMLASPQANGLNTGAAPAGFVNPGATPGIPVPFGNPMWATALSRQLQGFTRELSDGSHQMELRLDPPQLGPLRVSVNLFDSQAQLVFASQHAAVRNAVESALPQLQQALAEAGISLGETFVGEHGQGQSEQSNQAESRSRAERLAARDGAATSNADGSS